MRHLRTGLLGVIFAASAAPAISQLTLYENFNSGGQSVELHGDTNDFRSAGFNDRASSARLSSGCTAILYADVGFRGRSWTMTAGSRWNAFNADLNDVVSSARVDCGGGWGGGGGGGGGGERGVTIYVDAGFRGNSETFTSDVPRLSNTRVGNDSVSSVRVPSGCRAEIFADDNFRGPSMEIRSDLQNMSYQPVGNDQASSMRVSCSGWGGGGGGGGSDGGGSGGGITLFHDAGFRGGSQTFTSDVSDMKGSSIGHDAAASLRLGRGCTAILFTDRDYRGRSERVVGDVADLAKTSIGRDSLSSFRLNCGSGGGWGAGGAPRRAVRIYREPGYRSMAGTFSNDNPYLSSEVGSVDLDPGCRVTFYEGRNFEGRSVEVSNDQTNLNISRAGSVRVNCGY